MKLFKITLVIFLLCDLLACSRTDVAYRFADTAIIYRTDDFFDLKSEQKQELKLRIQVILEKIRKEKFPEFARKLRQWAPLTKETQITYPDLLKIASEVQSDLKLVSDYFLETSIWTALSLKNEQFDYLKKKIHEEIDDASDPQDWQKLTFKKYRRSFEFWLGGLSSLQKEKLSNFLKTNPFPSKLQNDSRLFVLEKFLKSRESHASLEKFVRDFFADYESVRLLQFQSALNQHKQSFIKFLAEEFWPTLDQSQRQHFHQNLLDRASELERISQRL
jgi:hypothetical protein